MLPLLLGVALAGPCPLPSAKSPPTALSEVDWCNRDYHTVFGALRDGRAEYHEWEADLSGHSTTLQRLVAVVAGKDVVVVALSDETALMGGGGFTGGTLLAFGWKDGAPVELARSSTPKFEAVEAHPDGVLAKWTTVEGPQQGIWGRKGAEFVLAPPTSKGKAVKAPSP